MMSPEFLERQRLFLRRAGVATEEIDVRLIATIGEAAVATSRRQNVLATWLEQFREELGPAFVDIEAGLQEFRHEADLTLRPVWRAFRSIAIHAALIVAMAAFLIGIAGFLVPVFEWSYLDRGVRLPVLTSWVFRPFYSNVVLWLAVAGVAGLFWQIRRLRQWTTLARVGVGRFSARLGRAWGLDGFWHVLLLAIIRAACRSGMRADAALETARRVAISWSGITEPVDTVLAELRAPLSAADSLGTLDAELAYQIEDRWRSLPTRVLARGELLALCVNIALGVLVGLLVVALYLPLFTLSSAI